CTGAYVDCPVQSSPNQKRRRFHLIKNPAQQLDVMLPVAKRVEQILCPARPHDIRQIALNGARRNTPWIAIHSLQNRSKKGARGQDHSQEPPTGPSIEKSYPSAASIGPRINRRTKHQRTDS